MVLAVLKIFVTKDYYFTTDATKQVLTQNECFLSSEKKAEKAEKAENLSA